MAYGLELTEEDLTRLFQSTNAKALLQKYRETRHTIDIEIKNNIIVDKSRDNHSYETALITSFIMEYLLKNNISFSFEIVMSHKSKLDEIIEAKKQGYQVYHICHLSGRCQTKCIPSKHRVQKRGHYVDSDKILSNKNKSITRVWQNGIGIYRTKLQSVV
jgi:predicted ABC-type ATPase